MLSRWSLWSSDGLTDSLIEIYPKYSAAVESSDVENVDQAIKLLGPLAESKDKFLAADANFYLARTLMNSERYEEAMPLLDQLMGEMGAYSAHQGSAQYFKGVAQAGLLQNQQAIDSFMEFVAEYPNAPERLRVSAWRQVQQLQGIEEGKLDDVYQRMDYSRRRLTQIETGDKTQEEQSKIVAMLTKMIKEEEKKEASSSAKKGGTWEAGKQASGQKPSEKAESQSSGKGQKGGQSNNPNGKVVKTYDDSPASPWSRLRDRLRDPANNAVKEKLPARYRDIVEKYRAAADGEFK